MTDKITKRILSDVQSALDEYDIEGMINQFTDKEQIKRIVDQELKDLVVKKVTEAYEGAIYKAIHEQQPIIDAFVSEKVRGATIAADKAMRENY